jgi:hypothetical protein
MEFGDIPGEDLTRRRGAEFGFYMSGSCRLIATLSHFTNAVKNAIHRRHRAMINAFVQEGSIDMWDTAVDESRLVNRV